MDLKLVNVPLDPTERRVLTSGLAEWFGPARPTEEVARAMGFADVADLDRSVEGLIDAIQAHAPLTPTDWVRALLATEIAFVSDLVGSGTDWESTVGLPDDVTLDRPSNAAQNHQVPRPGDWTRVRQAAA